MGKVIFGWAAPSMKEQFPTLPEFEADQFDLDSAALTRLRVRGYLTDSQRMSVARKVSKAIVRAALEQSDES